VKIYPYTESASRLRNIFSLDSDRIRLENEGLIIKIPLFRSHVLRKTPGLLSDADRAIKENQTFRYIIFSPEKKKQAAKAVLMLHGLNERTWDKYLPWASFLAGTLQRPVVLFPIAFHMNRSAPDWLEKRTCFRLFQDRSKETGSIDRGSFANTVLSQRLEADPLKFFSSGLQTYMDIIDLVRLLRNGENEDFRQDTIFSIFGYSIGAFLGQILLMCDPEDLFTQSRLFLFCGGAVLNRMNPRQKTILDSGAAAALRNLARKITGKDTKEQEHWRRLASLTGEKEILYFQSMLDEQYYSRERDLRNRELRDRMTGIALKQDRVVPSSAVREHLGSLVCETDFPYAYKHESPFPSRHPEPGIVDSAFHSVFTRAAEYLH
jgi:hypothetical protein